MKEQLGFIGLGIMGKPMAKNLINAGYELIVNDINPSPVEELSNMGATVSETPAHIAKTVKKIITMLPDGPEVEEVVLGKNGVIEGVAPETSLIDMSSISPTITKKIVLIEYCKRASAIMNSYFS